MLFPTVNFAIFFMIVLAASWLLMPFRLRWKFFMLAASYIFYGWWNPAFVGLIAGVTVLNHAVATAIERLQPGRIRRTVLGAGIAADLGILAWFKYYGFFISSATNVLARFGIDSPLPFIEIVLPVGVSFFIFQAISYIVDLARSETKYMTLLDFAVYLSFFPQLVAGPIVRASELGPQLRSRRDPRVVDSGRAFWLIGAGLFKKVVVANMLATELVDRVFAYPSRFHALEVIIAVYGYAVQIYADFSGYTDMAIGIALLLGFTFPDNFNRPYAAVTLQDFWRRWHMTLSRWLRDYLYISLGGSHGSARATERNIMITMLLGGLWHGAAWTFVVWGGIHGAWQILERRGWIYGGAQPQGRDRLWRGVITFHVVCLAWIFFRADSFTTAWSLLRRIIIGWTTPFGLEFTVPAFWIPLAIILPLTIQFVPEDINERLMAFFSQLHIAVQSVMMSVFLLLVQALGPQGVAPFIYFQF